ncbi:galanin-like G-protein coupled receptor npr-9 [Macrobrachium rosenbergii]|uniref:galanin-like G-protein coupled receptor npr-9 n=1 Tax=Macrobrachium rosenbergii TaxID=79674 RepID=UPI0034D799CD
MQIRGIAINKERVTDKEESSECRPFTLLERLETPGSQQVLEDEVAIPLHLTPEEACIHSHLGQLVGATALLASVLTLTVISVGRVVAVMFPLHARTSPDRAHRVIAAVWITSAVLACPSLFYRELYSIKLPEWFSVVEFSAYFVAYSNSALNPIIYCGFNANFRQGLVSLLTCRRSSTGRIYHQRWTTKWTGGHDRMDLPGSNCKGMTIGTRETTVGLSGPEPAVLLEFNSLRNSSRYPQRCSVTAQSGRMLMSASATDIRNIAFTDLHPDYPSKRFGGSVCRSESQCASPAITSTVFPDDQPHHAPPRGQRKWDIRLSQPPASEWQQAE